MKAASTFPFKLELSHAYEVIKISLFTLFAMSLSLIVLFVSTRFHVGVQDGQFSLDSLSMLAGRRLVGGYKN